MGKKNTVTKEYMSITEYFADAFNYYVFQGKQVIKNENLMERDISESTKTLGMEISDIIQKDRDVLKQCVLMEDAKYTLFDVRNRESIPHSLCHACKKYDLRCVKLWKAAGGNRKVSSKSEGPSRR